MLYVTLFHRTKGSRTLHVGRHISAIEGWLRRLVEEWEVRM
jgi:hypothetical protein